MSWKKSLRAAVSNVRTTAKAAVNTGRELLRGPVGQVLVQAGGQALGIPPQASGAIYSAFGGQGFGNLNFGALPPNNAMIDRPDGGSYNGMYVSPPPGSAYAPQRTYAPPAGGYRFGSSF